MALDKYYFVLSEKPFWARSFDEPGQVNAPTFGNNDVRDFGVTFLRPIGSGIMEVLPGNYGVRIDLADPATPGTSITGVAGTANDNNEYEFLLPITDFTTFLGSATQPKSARCEFTLTAAGLAKNRYAANIFIAKNTSSDVPPDSAPDDRALGAGEAEGLYLAKQVPRYTVLNWPDEDTGQMYSVRLKGGQLRADIQ